MRRIPLLDDESGQSVVDRHERRTANDKVERVLTICNRRGLHARASARFVQTVDQFDAEVTVKRDGMSVGGLSIMGLMMLAATNGSDIHVFATGPDAGAVVAALAELVNDRFGEDS
ncbi:putative phosphocarrier hpr transmembrane protein [Fulvimarina pelagi HTCC2506]|uniref:Putative phosphocarrier hpr transmembrane protein n=1 Tax=Fulvimarina pelagi HTCC2506 TaxID=314231 RepID=Q0G6R1_9HYPH|nr:HPr family phosphocarrier protein [Fulvimarina pelagi]EAU42653.1 putative phosphocarrier hpr transmembrane protein [Fulvimarina pelagi HTCC2506]